MGCASKKEMSFLIGRQKRNEFSNRSGQDKRKMSNIAGLSRPTKQKRSFQTGEKNNNNISDLDDNKCKCVNEMCLSVFNARL